MISDRMALAAADGRLEEFLQHEIPEGDHARNLALMMMGMSGLMPTEMGAGLSPAVPPHGPSPPAPDEQTAGAPEVPPEVLAAIQRGDVANLTGILRAEHAKRSAPCAREDGAPQSPEATADARPAIASPPFPAAPPTAPAGDGRAGIDAAVIDELIRISADNDVTVDWLMLRAVKLYVEEYRETGRL
jgi:hypothetical protein